MVQKDKVKQEKTSENKINPNIRKLKIATALSLLLKLSITHNYLTAGFPWWLTGKESHYTFITNF